MSTIYAHKGAACERNSPVQIVEKKKGENIKSSLDILKHATVSSSSSTPPSAREANGERKQERKRERHQVTFLLNTVT